MKQIINIIPVESFENKSYKNALAYCEGDDRMLVGEVAEMIAKIEAELNVKLVDADDKSAYGQEIIGWVICMWCGGASYAMYAKPENEPESKEVVEVVEVINPQYVDMSAAEIKKAEQDYDNLHNEGGEGYNPYRDNLTVFRPTGRAIKIKTSCIGNHVHTTLANPLAPLGDIRDASVQIRQINNIPDGVDHFEVVKKWSETCDMTRIMTGKQRLEFDYSEIGGGRIIKS